MATNTIPLNKELADQLIGLNNKIRSSLIELATIAAKIRNQHLDASGKKYDAEFHGFWKAHSMEKNFGSLSNFTKYANAGDAIELVKAQFDKYEKRLPTTMSALYEFSLLTTEEMELCLEDTFTRTEVTSDRSKWKQAKKPKPLITPSTTAGAIKSWRTNWRNPKAPVTDKRRLKIAEIKVHGSLYDFKGGKHTGILSIETMAQISEALKKAVEQFPEAVIRIDLEDEKLKQGYEKRLNAEVEKHTKSVSDAKKKTEKTEKKVRKKSVKRLKTA